MDKKNRGLNEWTGLLEAEEIEDKGWFPHEEKQRRGIQKYPLAVLPENLLFWFGILDYEPKDALEIKPELFMKDAIRSMQYGIYIYSGCPWLVLRPVYYVKSRYAGRKNK